MADSRTTEDWIDRLRPAFETSLDAVSQTITNTPAVQDWLRSASLEQAMGLEGASDLAAQSTAYAQMLDDLAERFPALIDAIEQLTAGCGRLDLKWRPLSPQFSTIFVTFAQAYDVDVFVRLNDATEDAARDALNRIADALPKGAPFPKRPHEVEAVVGHAGRCLGVRLYEHAADRGRRRTVTLRAAGMEPLERLAATDAVAPMLAYLTAAEDSA